MRIQLVLIAMAVCGSAAADPLAVPSPAAGTTTHTVATTVSRSASVAGKSDTATRSKVCSDQADAKNLHGKDRKKFRSACRRGKAL